MVDCGCEYESEIAGGVRGKVDVSNRERPQRVKELVERGCEYESGRAGGIR